MSVMPQVCRQRTSSSAWIASESDWIAPEPVWIESERAAVRRRLRPRPRLPLQAFVTALALLLSVAGRAQQPQYAEMGSCALESGQVIENCRLEYRTFGQLRGKGENAVLFPTWFSGVTENLTQYVGEQARVDPSRYFVILVGAFGNGLSSSPSNSKTQPAGAFPEYTIGDVVRAQHRLLTEKLGIERLHVVMGISMGPADLRQQVWSKVTRIERAQWHDSPPVP